MFIYSNPWIKLIKFPVDIIMTLVNFSMLIVGLYL